MRACPRQGDNPTGPGGTDGAGEGARPSLLPVYRGGGGPLPGDRSLFTGSNKVTLASVRPTRLSNVVAALRAVYTYWAHCVC